MIIFINGTSSAGKSEIAREIMHQAQRPFLYHSVDHLVNFWMDEKFFAFDREPIDWVDYEPLENDKGLLQAHILEGPHVAQLHEDMIEALTVFIKKGYDLIIDEVLWNASVFSQYAPALCQSNRVYLVKVTCNLIECERREQKRTDRFNGLTRALYSHVYSVPAQYDLEVDTTYTCAKECANSILQFIEKQPQPQAFLAYLPTSIAFRPLTADHFPLLAQWLNTPHVTTWWREVQAWTLSEVQAKYQSYTQGYKLVNGQKKAIAGFVIYCDAQPIGYIQFYNAYDFPREGYRVENLPASIAALDLFIGDPHYIGKRIAAPIISQFLQKMVWPKFDACFVDPDNTNLKAIQAYEKAGFKIIQQLKTPAITWMLIQKK